VRFGCCGSMISPSADPVGVDIVESLAEAGFDYIELSLRDLVKLDDRAFSEIGRRVERSGIRAEACNNFFPPDLRLTGADARPSAALDYARKAMDRAARLGVRVIVFGSAEARNVPRGFSGQEAWKQLVELLANMGPIARRFGVAVAVEPLNPLESNIINLGAEALRLVREVNEPGVELLLDYYHLGIQREDEEIVLQAGPALGHVHFAKVLGRTFPEVTDNASLRFFSFLKRASYSGRCSIEAYTKDFEIDSRRALSVLKELEKRA